MYIHKRSYLASFLYLHCVQLASLYCHASFGYWYNKKGNFLEERCRLFRSQIMKRRTSTNNSELIVANKTFSYLPTNWLDKLEEVNGDSITNEGSILYSKSILHIHINSWAWDTACEQLFSRTMDSRIDWYRDNTYSLVHHVYIISFIKKFIQNKCNIRGWTCTTICLMRAQT